VPATLIVNPWASGVTPELVAAVERELAAAGPVETVLTTRAGHATELAADASESSERIYVFSGDGGFNEVVNGVRHGVPLAFLPGGGTSVLPRALGIPRDPLAAARTLSRFGRERIVSTGRVEASLDGEPTVDRRFAFGAGLGLDAELVRAIDRRGRTRGRRPGDAAFALELGRLLVARRGKVRAALTVVGHGRAAFAIVANTDPYTYAGPVAFHVAPDARFELGLDLAAPTELSPLKITALPFALSGRGKAKWILRAHDEDELRIEADGPMPLQLDGEDVGDVTAATFRAERESLRVLVPR
jgi:diacylglycerol kinase family enzyme